jgi:hypothetical protein
VCVRNNCEQEGMSVESNGLFSDWIALVRAEFLEMPGLALTKGQMRRLWALDASACDAIVEVLTSSEFLCQRADRTFMRRDVQPSR